MSKDEDEVTIYLRNLFKGPKYEAGSDYQPGELGKTPLFTSEPKKTGVIESDVNIAAALVGLTSTELTRGMGKSSFVRAKVGTIRSLVSAAARGDYELYVDQIRETVQEIKGRIVKDGL